MGRYQLGDQFCSIDRDGTRITIVQPDGATQIEELATPELASTRYRVLTNQKLRAGWKLAPPVVEAPPPSAPERIVENATNPELEAALLDDPHNVEAWRVYGDWLQQQGDPRGLYIALYDAVRNDPHDLVATERLRKHEHRHYAYLYGDTLQPHGTSGTLGWGFVDELQVTTPRGVTTAFGAPAGRFITTLEIGHVSNKRLAEIVDALGVVSPRTLRRLTFVGDGELVTLEPIAAVLARLHVLELHCRPSTRCLEYLASAPLSKLRRLAITNRDAAVGVEDILARRDLDSLVELYVNDPDPLVDAIARSRIAKQLTKLTLVQFDEPSAQRLVAFVDAGKFPQLADIEVPHADLSADICRRLATIGHLAAPSSRYIPIDE